MRSNLKGLESIWNYAYAHGIDYMGSNIPIDRCYKCGYQGDFKPTETGYQCPICKNDDPKTVEVTKRTCGYLGNPQVRKMIHGRHEELSSRVKEISGETGRVTLNGDVQCYTTDRAVDPHKM